MTANLPAAVVEWARRHASCADCNGEGTVYRYHEDHAGLSCGPCAGTGVSAGALRELSAILETVRAEAVEAPLIYHSNGEAGDGQNICGGCGDERDEPHTWKECAAVLLRARDHFMDRLIEADRKLDTERSEAVAAEREACARVCEEERRQYLESAGKCAAAGNSTGELGDTHGALACRLCAGAIRQRTEQEREP